MSLHCSLIDFFLVFLCFLQFRFLDGGLLGKEDDVNAVTQGEGPRAASVELLNAEEASKFDVNGVSEWSSK